MGTIVFPGVVVRVKSGNNTALGDKEGPMVTSFPILFFSVLHVRVCMYKFMCVCTCPGHVCGSQKLTSGATLNLSQPFPETASHTEPGALPLCSTGWAHKAREPPMAVSLVPAIQVYTTLSGHFVWVPGD